MNWKIGDRAIVLRADHAELVGVVVTIMSVLTKFAPNGLRWKYGISVHMTDIPSLENPGWLAAFRPENLGPIPDDKYKRFHPYSANDIIGPHFDGDTYKPAFDHTRLTNQLGRVYGVMLDGKWRTLAQLSNLAKAPESSVSARLRDMRKAKFGGHTVNRKRGDKYNDGLFYYRLEIEPQQEMRL